MVISLDSGGCFASVETRENSGLWLGWWAGEGPRVLSPHLLVSPSLGLPVSRSPCLSVSLSLGLPVSRSPCLSVSLSLGLRAIGCEFTHCSDTPRLHLPQIPYNDLE